MKEGFCDLFDATGRKIAIELYRSWNSSMIYAFWGKELAPLATASIEMTDWAIEYYRWFEHPVLRKYEETVETFMKSVHRLGRSDSFPAVRAKILSMEAARTDKGISLVKLAEILQEEK